MESVQIVNDMLKLFLFLYITVSPSIDHDFIVPYIDNLISMLFLLGAVTVLSFYDITFAIFAAVIVTIWMLYVYEARIRQKKNESFYSL
jgi:hypothetical protein